MKTGYKVFVFKGSFIVINATNNSGDEIRISGPASIKQVTVSWSRNTKEIVVRVSIDKIF